MCQVGIYPEGTQQLQRQLQPLWGHFGDVHPASVECGVSGPPRQGPELPMRDGTPNASPDCSGLSQAISRRVVQNPRNKHHSNLITPLHRLLRRQTRTPQAQAARGYAGHTWPDQYLGISSMVSRHGSTGLRCGGIRKGRRQSANPLE